MGPSKSSTQTASRSLQPFLQGSLGDIPTDRPADQAIRFARSLVCSLVISMFLLSKIPNALQHLRDTTGLWHLSLACGRNLPRRFIAAAATVTATAASDDKQIKCSRPTIAVEPRNLDYGQGQRSGYRRLVFESSFKSFCLICNCVVLIVFVLFTLLPYLFGE